MLFSFVELASLLAINNQAATQFCRIKGCGGRGSALYLPFPGVGALKTFRYEGVSPIFLGKKNLGITNIFVLPIPEESELILLGESVTGIK